MLAKTACTISQQLVREGDFCEPVWHAEVWTHRAVEWPAHLWAGYLVKV